MKWFNHLLLDIYPREKKACMHRKACTWMFIEALFVIAKNWKQTQMSINRWIDKQIVVYPYSEILRKKEKKLLIYVMTWVNLKITMLNERSQEKRCIVQCMIKNIHTKLKWQKADQWLPEDREEGEITKGTWWFHWCIHMSKYKLYALSMCSSLYVNYTHPPKKCPSANEWIKNLWYIYTMEFYVVERKKELIPFATA